MRKVNRDFPILPVWRFYARVFQRGVDPFLRFIESAIGKPKDPKRVKTDIHIHSNFNRLRVYAYEFRRINLRKILRAHIQLIARRA